MLLLFVHRFDQVAGLKLRRRAECNADVHGVATRDAGKNLNATLCRDSHADCDACRIRPPRHGLAVQAGYSKLDESMIVRPRLPYRPVVYFSVDYARYAVRTVVCRAWRWRSIGSALNGCRAG